MPSVAIVPTKNRDQIEIEELQLELQLIRHQVAEMTLDLEDLKLEVRHFQKAYDLRVACLLYTSPSPRDRSVSRMPSSA